MEPYFEKSGQGKLFYEPADGPQQAKQREQKERRRGFENRLESITKVNNEPGSPDHREKLRQRLQADEPRDAGGLTLRQTHDFQSASEKHGRRWELGRGAGLEPEELNRRQWQFGHTPERLDTPGSWGASPPSANYPVFADRLKEEAASRSREGLRRKRAADLARGMAVETTVPLSDLEGITHVGIERHNRENVAGTYWGRPGGPVAYIQLEPDVGENPHTLTHEVGHHVSTRTPGYEARKELSVPGPVSESQRPREEAFADDYTVQHGQDPGYEASARFDVEQQHLQPWRTSEFSQEYLAARTNLSPEEFAGVAPEQTAMFQIEDAIAPDADANVQAYTRDEGREVLGWGPMAPSEWTPREHLFKHDYKDEAVRDRGDFVGANYVSLFNDDVVPERRMDDWQEQSFRHTDPVVRQIWKQKR